MSLERQKSNLLSPQLLLYEFNFRGVRLSLSTKNNGFFGGRVNLGPFYGGPLFRSPSNADPKHKTLKVSFFFVCYYSGSAAAQKGCVRHLKEPRGIEKNRERERNSTDSRATMEEATEIDSS